MVKLGMSTIPFEQPLLNISFFRRQKVEADSGPVATQDRESKCGKTEKGKKARQKGASIVL
jgi:hypothetical protein